MRQGRMQSHLRHRTRRQIPSPSIKPKGRCVKGRRVQSCEHPISQSKSKTTLHSRRTSRAIRRICAPRPGPRGRTSRCPAPREKDLSSVWCRDEAKKSTARQTRGPTILGMLPVPIMQVHREHRSVNTIPSDLTNKVVPSPPVAYYRPLLILPHRKVSP